MATQQDTCPTCGYNLPHHGPGCPKAESLSGPFCPAHAPGTAALSGDDGRLRCRTCGQEGYHVKFFKKAS